MQLWMIAAFGAFFVKGLCGFANTLVFTTVLSFGANNLDISPVELLLSYPANAILAWRERRGIDRHICVPASLMVLGGCVLGALVLKNAAAGPVKIVFGAAIILTGIEMLLRDAQKRQKRASPVVLFVIGILSGLLCGLYGAGALMGAYVSRVTDDPHAFRANLSVIFFVENTFRIVLYIALGIMTAGVIQNALILTPFSVGGLLSGMAAARVLSDRTARRIVMILLIVSGAALIVTNL